MSQYFDLDKNVLLELDFPEAKFGQLLSELNLPSIDDMKHASFEQKRLVIVAAFREFLKGNLMLEEFSEIANYLKMNFPLETRTEEQETYETMIYEAADMGLHVRTFVPNHGNSFSGYMDTMWVYFNKYKHLLSTLPEKYSVPSTLEKE